MLLTLLHLVLATPVAPLPLEPADGTWIGRDTWIEPTDYEDDAGVPLAAMLLDLRREPGAYDGRYTFDAGPVQATGSWFVFGEDDAGWCWRAQYVNAQGQGSGWGPEACFRVDTTSPPRPGRFDAGVTPGSARVDVSGDPVVDVPSGLRGYFIAYSARPGGPWFSNPEVHPGLPFTEHLGPGTWYVAAEALDVAGNASWLAGTVDVPPVDFAAVTVTAAPSLASPPPPGWGRAYTNDWGAHLAYDWRWAQDAGATRVALAVAEVDGGALHHVGCLSVDPSWPSMWVSSAQVRREGVFVGRLSAIIADQASDWSAPSAPIVVDATPPSAPAPPTAQPLATRDGPVVVTWADASDNLSGVRDYTLEVTEESSGARATYLVDALQWTATSPAEGRWRARVKAWDRADNDSPYSAPSAVVVVDRTGPVAGSAPLAAAGDGGVVVSFAAPSDALSALASVELQRTSAAGETAVVPASGSPVVDTPPAGTWTWRVRATDALGNVGAFSAPSNAVTVTADGVVVVTPPVTHRLRVGCEAAPLGALGLWALAWLARARRRR